MITHLLIFLCGAEIGVIGGVLIQRKNTWLGDTIAPAANTVWSCAKSLFNYLLEKLNKAQTYLTKRK